MTNSAPKTSTQPSGNGMRSEIQKKWGKFSSDEISSLKSVDELVAQVQSKYQIDKAKAQSDVDAFANGRPL